MSAVQVELEETISAEEAAKMLGYQLSYFYQIKDKLDIMTYIKRRRLCVVKQDVLNILQKERLEEQQLQRDLGILKR